MPGRRDLLVAVEVLGWLAAAAGAWVTLKELTYQGHSSLTSILLVLGIGIALAGAGLCVIARALRSSSD